MRQVEIRIMGHIDRDWSDWIHGLVITQTEEGETVLNGSVRDYAALYGLLSRLADLGLKLELVSCGPRLEEATVNDEAAK